MEQRILRHVVMLLLLMVLLQAACWSFQRNDYVYTASIQEDLPTLPRHVFRLPRQEAVQGLHIALAGPHSLKVTWMTPAPWSSGSFSPMCFYGTKGKMDFKVKGMSYSYTAGMFNHTLNTAVLDIDTKLIPCLLVSPSPPHCVQIVSYRCGDKQFGFSEVYHARVYPDTEVPQTSGMQFAIIGDMGVPHGLKTLDSVVTRMGQNTKVSNTSSPGGVQMLLHVGDIAYADDYGRTTHNNSWVWVEYMNSMEKVATSLPYMTCPGNHEAQFAFAAYLNWLPMPHNVSGSGSPFWFSFDYLGVHLLFYSTEHDFSPNSTQHRWMQQDLKQANKNRARVPWVVVLGHRPLYCTSWIAYKRCFKQGRLYQTYIENLLYESRVDVVIAGHIHHYERSYPVYKNKTVQKDYINPRAPVHIVNGAAGNPEPNDPTFVPNVDWRAWYKITAQTGFLLMTPTRSQLSFEYVLSDSNEVIDSFTITKKSS